MPVDEHGLCMPVNALMLMAGYGTVTSFKQTSQGYISRAVIVIEQISYPFDTSTVIFFNVFTQIAGDFLHFRCRTTSGLWDLNRTLDISNRQILINVGDIRILIFSIQYRRLSCMFPVLYRA